MVRIYKERSATREWYSYEISIEKNGSPYIVIEGFDFGKDELNEFLDDLAKGLVEGRNIEEN